MAKKASKTKLKLLDISKQLMMSKGYNATKVEEICQMAEVTKGAFFYYFKTKEDLGMSVLDYYWQERQAQFMASDWLASDDPFDRIEGFLAVVADVFMNDPHGYSCLAGSFTQELADTNTDFREIVSGLFDEWSEQIKPVLQEANERSGNHVDIDLLADYIVVVTEGALILAVARQDRQVIAQHLNLLNTHIRSVFSV